MKISMKIPKMYYYFLSTKVGILLSIFLVTPVFMKSVVTEKLYELENIQ